MIWHPSNNITPPPDVAAFPLPHLPISLPWQAAYFFTEPISNFQHTCVADHIIVPDRNGSPNNWNFTNYSLVCVSAHSNIFDPFRDDGRYLYVPSFGPLNNINLVYVKTGFFRPPTGYYYSDPFRPFIYGNTAFSVMYLGPAAEAARQWPAMNDLQPAARAQFVQAIRNALTEMPTAFHQVHHHRT